MDQMIVVITAVLIFLLHWVHMNAFSYKNIRCPNGMFTAGINKFITGNGYDRYGNHPYSQFISLYQIVLYTADNNPIPNVGDSISGPRISPNTIVSAISGFTFDTNSAMPWTPCFTVTLSNPLSSIDTEVGTLFTYKIGSVQCIPCPENHFCYGGDCLDSCINCASGTFTKKVGAAACTSQNNASETCPVGTGSVVGLYGCYNCLTGTFQNGSFTVCEPCHSNSSSGFGATECSSLCPAGSILLVWFLQIMKIIIYTVRFRSYQCT
jgi:hypothetical protein